MTGLAPRHPDRRSAGRATARGSMTVELVVLVPLLVLFALLAVGLGRYEAARQEVVDAAHAGADAASVAGAAALAPSAAARASEAALSGQPHMCASPVVRTDASGFAPGGIVRVTVGCQVALSDLMVPGLPGRLAVTVTQAAPVDPYRVVG